MIGIMQGRLSSPEPGRFQAFPRSSWRQEFERAADAGLGAIEWIFDTHGEGANPLESDDGIGMVKQFAERYGVAIRSVCADYFMEKPLFKGDESERTKGQRKLEWLLGRCQILGIKRMVIPFVDQSRLESRDDQRVALDGLNAVYPYASDSGVEIHLETSLAPTAFAEFMGQLPSDLFWVNYDSGNSASLGYSPREEFDAYGNRVGSVHIKDRLLGGGTVPLGTGNVDFASLFACLRTFGYVGDFVLQAARDTHSGDEVVLARRNRAFVEQHLRES